MEQENAAAVPLDALVTVLDTAVVQVHRPDSGLAGQFAEVTVGSVALVDTADLGTVTADLVFLTADATTAFARLAVTPGAALPTVVAARENTVPPELPAPATAAGCTVLVLDARARWDVLLPRVQHLFVDEPGQAVAGHHATASSLEELAVLLADDIGGLVTIEDAGNRVLAYSPSLNAADDIRARAILGRGAPPPVMALFSAWDVVDTITRTTDVIRVPADPALGMHSRLITGIHRADGSLLGSIWVQEGPHGFTADAAAVLRGGAVAAVSVLHRMTDGADQEDELLRRLFGEYSEEDAAVAAGMLRIVTEDSAVVIGLAAAAGVAPNEDLLLSTVKRLRIHVGALWTDARVALLGRRIYLLLPRVPSGTDITVWTEQLLERFDDQEAVRQLCLRAAIAPVITDTGTVGVPRARAEVDRVLTSSGSGDGSRVTTFERSRTAVLLSEIVARLSPYEEVADPRLNAVADYDTAHGSFLMDTLRAYLRSGCNARDAARFLNLHPNTLRYRIARVEALSGLDLHDPDDRLLTEMVLLVRG